MIIIRGLWKPHIYKQNGKWWVVTTDNQLGPSLAVKAAGFIGYLNKKEASK